MTDKTKTIAEALAEVQRIANLQKGIRVAEMNSEITGEPLDEAGMASGLFNTVKNVVKNVSLGAKGAAPAGQRVGGRFGSASTADRAANKVGKTVVKPVVDNPKLASAGAGAGLGGTIAGVTSKPKTDTAGTQGVATGTSFAAIDKAKTTPAAAKPKVGGSHTQTTLKPSATGDQSKIQSTKTVKGPADPGRWENEAKSKTGSMQQKRGGKILDTARTQLGRPDEKSSQSFLNKELGRSKPMSSISPTANPQQRWDASRKAAGVTANTTKALTTAAQSRPSETSTQNFLKSQGIGKKVAEETEVNPHIASFLELMGSKSGNIFEAAKKLSAKQKKIAGVAGDPEKIDAEDFKALRSKKVEEESKDFLGGSTITKDPKKYVDPSTPKVPYSQLPKPGNKAGEVISKAKGAAGMKEEVEEIVLEDFVEYHLEEGYDINDIVDFIEENYQLDELSRKTLKSYQRKATTSMERADRKGAAEEDKSMSTDGNKYPEKQERHMKNATKHYQTSSKREAGLKMVGKKLAKEDVSFSESELAYFEAVAKKSAHLRLGKGNEDERGMGDTVSDSDLTN